MKKRKESLEIKCGCGHWNFIPSHKFFQKNKVYDEKQRREILFLIPLYRASDTVRCKKCGNIVARSGELFRVRETTENEDCAQLSQSKVYLFWKRSPFF